MDGNLSVIDETRVSLNLTCGEFPEETNAQVWIVDFLRRCHNQDGRPFFRKVAEFLPGVPLYRHHRQSSEKEGYRCDVLAIPEPPYSELFGAMVFEVKKSDMPIGPGLNQLKDYMASVFDCGGIQVMPSFGFLFPCHKQKAATASWMAHQSMGSVCEENHRIKFYSGEERLLEFSLEGRLIWSTIRPRSGRGSGCR